MFQLAKQPEALLGWIGALGDPTRLRLLRLLEGNELGVAELCEVVQLPQSNVSRHLKVLGDEGWVKSRRQGTVHLYRAAVGEVDPAARKIWAVAREQTESWPAVKQDQIRLARRLAEKRQASEAFFAGAAGEWDRIREEYYGKAFAQQAMLAMLDDRAVVADLGCGTGAVAAQVAPWVGKVIGVDSSGAMLKAAGKRTAELGNVELRRGELTAAPVESGACDVAMLMLVLSYVNDVRGVIAEMARVLKGGGRAVVVDLMEHDREDFRLKMGQAVLGFEVGRIRGMMEEVGVRVKRAVELAPETGVKGPNLFLVSGVKD